MIWSRVTVMCSLGSVEGTQGPSPGPPNWWTCNLNLRTGSSSQRPLDHAFEPADTCHLSEEAPRAFTSVPAFSWVFSWVFSETIAICAGGYSQASTSVTDRLKKRDSVVRAV